MLIRQPPVRHAQVHEVLPSFATAASASVPRLVACPGRVKQRLISNLEDANDCSLIPPQIRDLSQHPALPPPPADLPPEECDHLHRLVRGQREDPGHRAQQQQDQGVAHQDFYLVTSLKSHF